MDAGVAAAHVQAHGRPAEADGRLRGGALAEQVRIGRREEGQEGRGPPEEALPEEPNVNLSESPDRTPSGVLIGRGQFIRAS